MPGDLRDDLAEAFKTHEAGDTNDKPTSGFSGADRKLFDDESDTGNDGATGPRVGAKDEVPADGEQEKKVEDEAKPEAEKKEERPAEEKPAEKIKAPASWKAEEREHWEAVSPAAKAAILRRERETEAALRVSAGARDFAATFERVIAPYQAYIAAEGSNPLQTVQNMMRTAHVLSSSPPGQKANEMARLIVNFGVDPQLLDSALVAALDGKPLPNAQEDAVARLLDQRLKPVESLINRFTQQEQQTTRSQQAELQTEWAAFAEKNEFANDLSQEMADLMEVAAKRGIKMGLSDAYARATMLHPQISKILEQRKTASGAAQQTAAAKRAKDASASVSTDAPGRGNQQDENSGSLRDDIVASAKALARR